MQAQRDQLSHLQEALEPALTLARVLNQLQDPVSPDLAGKRD